MEDEMRGSLNVKSQNVLHYGSRCLGLPLYSTLHISKCTKTSETKTMCAMCLNMILILHNNNNNNK